MDDKYVNILLLGETGTGKSTFINSFSNYLQHQSLEDAVNAENLICLLPVKFTIIADDGDLHSVRFGIHENEDAAIGESSTINTQAYEFAFGEKTIRIIDTPGINDSRGGADKDEENFEGIMRCIEQYKQLHAVCFLLKPDVTVLTGGFKYCLLELLSRFDRSAAQNIIFIFTRTRSALYQAPETLTSLRRLISDVALKEGVSIPLRYRATERRNCFFVDNEGFKYLVARHQGLRMGSESNLKESWEISQDASRRLITYILGDAEHPPLPPHDVQDTVDVNRACKLINQLFQPLQDMNAFLQESIDAIVRRRAEIESKTLSREELVRKLYVPHLELEEIALQHPATVCTSPKCTKEITTAGVGRKHFQQCHYPCFLPYEALRHVPLIGNLQLWHSCEMFDVLGICKRCRCAFYKHTTIYYEIRVRETQKLDETIQAELMDNEKFLAAKAMVIANAKREIEELTFEQSQIAVALAKFSHFVCKHSFVPIRDPYEDHLDRLIRSERHYQAGAGSSELIYRYEAMKAEHVRQKKLLEEDEEKNTRLITFADIMETYKKLKELPRSGKKITDLSEKVASGIAQRMKRGENVPMQSAKPDKSTLESEIERCIGLNDGREAMDLIRKFIESKTQSQGQGQAQPAAMTPGTADETGGEIQALQAMINDNPLRAIAKLWNIVENGINPNEMLSQFNRFASLLNGKH